MRVEEDLVGVVDSSEGTESGKLASPVLLLRLRGRESRVDVVCVGAVV